MKSTLTTLLIIFSLACFGQTTGTLTEVKGIFKIGLTIKAIRIDAPLSDVRRIMLYENRFTEEKFDAFVKTHKPPSDCEKCKFIEVEIDGKEYTFKELRAILFNRSA